MTKVKQKLLILDAMGVIFDFPEGDDVKHGLWPFLEEKGFSFTDEEKKRFEMEIYHRGTRGEISSLDFFRQILPKGVEARRIEAEYLSSNKFIIRSDLISTLEVLKDKYIIGVLSNDFSTWNSFLRKRFDIDKYFNLVVISDEARSRKPDKEIYDYFIKMLRIKNYNPEKIYYVDDSLKNLHAASSYGFITIYKLLKTNDIHPFQPDYSIKNISQLLKILNR